MNQVAIITRGMNCDGYESRIAKALTQLEGALRVNAGHRAGCVEFAFSQEIAEAVIERRIEELGYGVAK